jgi:hypothetical protein
MQQVKKWIGLSTLIIFCLGLMNFVQFHFFVYPFQINEVLFLIISLLAVFKDKINQRNTLVLFGTFAFFNLMVHDLIYSFFMDYEQIHVFFESGWIDLLKLVNHLVFLSFLFLCSKKDENKKYLYIAMVSYFALITLAAYFESQLFIISAFATGGLLLLNTVRFKNYGALVLFLGFLESIKYLLLLLANF